MIPSLFGNSTSSSGNSSSAVYVPRSPLSSEAELNSTFNPSDYKGYLCKIGVHIWQSQPVAPSDLSQGYEWRNLELTASEINAQNSYTQSEIDNFLALKQTTANLETDSTASISSIKYYSTAASTEVIDAKIKAFKDGVSFTATNAIVTGDLNASEVKIEVPEATADTSGVTKVINELNDNSPHPPKSAPINQAIVTAVDAIKGNVSDEHNTLLKLSTDVKANKAALTTTNADLNTVDKLGVAHTNLANNTYNKQEVDDKDTQAKDRANHTGTQPIATVENLQSNLDNLSTALNSKVNTSAVGATDGIAPFTGNVVAIQHLSKDARNLQSVDTFAELPTGDNINLNSFYFTRDTSQHYFYDPSITDWAILSGGGGSSGGTTTVNLAITEHSTTSFKLSNSAGTDPIIPASTSTKAGLQTVAHHNKLEALPTSTELNNSFTNVNNAITDKQSASEKNQVNGYVGLNANGKVDEAYLPQKIITVANYETLPANGISGRVYNVESGAKKGHHSWSDEDNTYYSAKPDPDLTPYLNRSTDTLDNITAGSDNLHYTSAINTRLANTQGTNTGDETTQTIQTKRPLGTVNNQSLEDNNIVITTDDVDAVTNKRYVTDAQLAKIDSVATGADVSVQPNWNEADTTSKAFIKNKPTIPEFVQSDWNEDVATSKAYIKNKPSVLSAETRYTCGQLVFHVADSVQGCLKFDSVSLYSKATYAELYAIINNLVGNAFDNGDNFYLPDASGRVIGIAGAGAGLTARTLFEIFGAETHILKVDEMPEHKHNLNVWASNGNKYDVLVNGSDGSSVVEDMAIHSAGGNQPHNNMQPTLFAAQNLFIAY